MNRKVSVAGAGIVLLSASASPVWADENAGTFSPGYSRAHTNHAGLV
ncbi:TPA: hypothetical protein H2W01_004944 [Salmonella enterica]|nr:hypothetical protein [Salmonella enterica]